MVLPVVKILLGEGSLGGSPRSTDSGLEILHGGVGGDVELGARTSKHILLLAFDPLSPNSLSLYIVHNIIHSIISICLCLSIDSYCHIYYMLVCASLVLNHKSFI